MNQLYKLPKALLAILFIGGGIAFILLDDPPHTFCDTQIEHFRQTQTVVREGLKRERGLCEKENAPGACYEYFAYLKRFLRGFRLLSPECAELVYKNSETQNVFSSALALMTALAWREEILTGRVSKYNWLTRPDLFLFCDLKEEYKTRYGEASYLLLEKNILSLLPLSRKIQPAYLLKSSLLSENCKIY